MSDSIPAAARELLERERRVAFLGTCHDRNPHVAPLWYNLHEDHIEIATTGRKLANIRENERVTIAVQKDEDGHPQWGVVVQGTADVVDGQDGQAILRRINHRYGADADAWSENTSVRVAPGNVTYWSY